VHSGAVNVLMRQYLYCCTGKEAAASVFLLFFLLLRSSPQKEDMRAGASVCTAVRSRCCCDNMCPFVLVKQVK
jgi:hypothetical protein